MPVNLPEKEQRVKQEKSKKVRISPMDFDPKQTFKEMTVEELQQILYEVWMERDIDSFKGVLSAFLNVHNKQSIAKKMGVSRNTLYHMVSPEGNPTIDTIFRLLEILDDIMYLKCIGTDKTHCRTGTSGITLSTKCDDVSLILRPPQLGSQVY